ncbi:hypothetical protein PV08_02012 [Exophiala spinifera]|uniref:GPR1/FUN34/YaaH-class plasma membrane protein n=1 Tax=Exophiala spinifera TaxID=91928 RepID=A0A0D2A9J7_9EURO|nr:uncharacterized protein PV08_02012 [Exophiala spinifera]KIW21432.1 hypothetical protein PV08_02012 [Exophiala spinifera]
MSEFKYDESVSATTEAKANGIDHSRDDPLRRLRTADTVTMSPELFEKLYLSPQNAVKGDLRGTFGNPTPICLAGFLLSATPLSMVLLGWQGAGGLAAADVGAFVFFGGVLEIIGALLEWVLGNTFTAVVFCTFGGFFLTFASVLIPDFGAYSMYSTDASNPAEGLAQPAFFATFAVFLVAMAILTVVYCIASLRTNVIFFIIFLMLIPTFGCLASSFFALAQGRAADAQKYQHAGAGLLFAISLLGWYIFLALVLLAVDFPLALPVGDLSTVVKGASARAKVMDAEKGDA